MVNARSTGFDKRYELCFVEADHIGNCKVAPRTQYGFYLPTRPSDDACHAIRHHQLWIELDPEDGEGGCYDSCTRDNVDTLFSRSNWTWLSPPQECKSV